jgi:hypothetical protein
MGKPLALLLMVVGGGIIVTGAFLALRPLASMYQGVLDAPLDRPDGSNAPEDGKQVQQAMFKGIYIGAAGVPLMIAGRFMLARARRRQRLNG